MHFLSFVLCSPYLQTANICIWRRQQRHTTKSIRPHFVVVFFSSGIFFAFAILNLFRLCTGEWLIMITAVRRKEVSRNETYRFFLYIN